MMIGFQGKNKLQITNHKQYPMTKYQNPKGVKKSFLVSVIEISNLEFV